MAAYLRLGALSEAAAAAMAGGARGDVMAVTEEAGRRAAVDVVAELRAWLASH